MTNPCSPIITGNGWSLAPRSATPPFLVVFIVSAVVGAFLFRPVGAHVAPSGWIYPLQCCSNQDCEPVHGAGVVEGPKGYVVQGTGETIGYQDERVKRSPDGEFHLCRFKRQLRTICLFVPPRSF
jgi:hypothetical protein